MKYACLKRPFLSGDGHCLPPNTSVAYTLLESRVCYKQLLTPADNTKCPQFFHYLWNVCWVQSVASWWKSSNNEALSDFWQRHIQTHKNKFKHYHLCIILSWHVSLVTTICSQKTLTSTFFHSEIIWPKVYLIPLLPQKRSSFVKGWAVCVFEIPRFPFTTQLHRLGAARSAARRLEPQPCSCPQASRVAGSRFLS